ncbi:hypothetical protein DDB_G0274867 [Dictyostelium discoideum AX4]|uniref:Transmembrane protein n=1 Tax=Dictyostelium discoideum TaxID=44689 RepID=Q555J9_DICDI|nr:hypothetical protein DDB_G0274867 [Dictyostelium discoideum AX4]EAL70326.1 hypothetical protein DDB_G0274867 [Dictyostelium discoideum AX4]|eukprot:XP_644068.1 hypothetical protein DDB_G0274867 [Dictyostelium discoideum AX4]
MNLIKQILILSLMILFLLNNPTLIYGQNDNDNNNQQVKDANYSPYGGNELYNNNNLNNIDQIRQSSYYDYLQNLRPQDYIQIFKGVVKGLQNSINPQNSNICSQIIIYNVESSMYLSNELPLMLFQYNSTQIKSVVSNIKLVLQNFSNLNQNNICKFDLIKERFDFYSAFIDQFGVDQLILREQSFLNNNMQYFSKYIRAIVFDMYFGTYEDVGYNIGSGLGLFLNTPYA